MIPYGWTLKRIAEPAVEPVTLLEAKEQCRVDPDMADSDNVLNRYIKGAREEAEAYTKRAFVPSVFRYTMPGFPIIERWWGDQRIRLPVSPLIAIESFQYLTWDGVQTAMTPWDGVTLGDEAINQYWLCGDDEPPAIEPPYGEFWPIARSQAGAVQITFRAGYAPAGSPVDPDDISAVPEKARQAMLMLIGHWYENRESVVAGPRYNAINVPHAFEQTLDALKVYP